MDYVRRRYTRFCLASFAVTSGFGLLLALFPNFVGWMVGVAAANTFFARLLGLLLVVVGLAYLMALLYEEARVPLFVIATLEKTLAALYVLAAVFFHQAGWLGLGMVVVDTAIAVFGVMVISMPSETTAG